MKNKIAALLLILPLSVPVLAEQINMPKIGSGIKIVPLAQMDIPESMKKDLIQKMAEQKLKGYRESDNQNNGVRYLIDMQKNASMPMPLNLMAVSMPGKPKDTDEGIKRNLSEIKFSFPIDKIPSFEDQKNITVLGYTPCGGYTKNQPDEPGVEGWSGVKIFFTSPELGSCSYTLFYMKADRMTVELNAEMTEYLVNKKPSTRVIEGNIHSGFSYDLNWDSKDTMSDMECANLKFDKQIMGKMIELANKVDKK